MLQQLSAILILNKVTNAIFIISNDFTPKHRLSYGSLCFVSKSKFVTKCQQYRTEQFILSKAQNHKQYLYSLRAKNQITLPVILKNERQINVFLRTEDIDLINVINEETLLQQPEERFAWLRSKKDRF